jgi:hypothetical protein
MTKIKGVPELAEWLNDKIDPEDVESVTAFRTWLQSGQRGSFECYVAQEAWAELLHKERKGETLH